MDTMDRMDSIRLPCDRLLSYAASSLQARGFCPGRLVADKNDVFPNPPAAIGCADYSDPLDKGVGLCPCASI